MSVLYRLKSWKPGGWELALLLIALIGFIGCGVMDNGGDGKEDPLPSSGKDDDTIFDIQKGDVPQGTIVNLKNIVVTSKFIREPAGVFVSEPEGGPYSGIFLYCYDDVAANLDLYPGDVLNVTGEYTEYYDFSEVTVKNLSDIEVVTSGALPTPYVVDPAFVTNGGGLSEVYESVLVEVRDVKVINERNRYGQFTITGDLLVGPLFFTYDTTPSPPTGTHFDSIVGLLYFGYDDFQLLPRGNDDLDGDYAGVEVFDTTIYDIQQGLIPEGSVVNLTDIVVTSPVEPDGSLVFVQEQNGGAWSGIALYMYNEVIDALDPQVGDVYHLTGVYEEFYDMSEIKVTTVDNVELVAVDQTPKASVVDPADVTTGGSDAEKYESVLIRVEDVTVTAEANNYGEWTIDGGLKIDDFFFASSPALGTEFKSITGPLTFSYEEFKLIPRFESDLDQ